MPEQQVHSQVVSYEREEVAACETDPFFHQAIAKGGTSQFAIEPLDSEEVGAVFNEMCPREPAWGLIYENNLFNLAGELIENYAGGYWPTYAVFDKASNQRITWFRILRQSEPVTVHWALNWTHVEGVDPAVAGLIAHLFALSYTSERLGGHLKSHDEFIRLRNWFCDTFPNEAGLVLGAID